MKLEMISKYPVVHFLDYFAQRGRASHAVSLRRHGKSEGRGKLRWTRIGDFVEDAANVMAVLLFASLILLSMLKYLSRGTRTE